MFSYWLVVDVNRFNLLQQPQLAVWQNLGLIFDLLYL